MPPSAEGMNELWLAIGEGDTGWVKGLLEAGRCPHTRYKGWTPLMKAAEDDKVEIMELLLKHRAEPDAMNRRGRTALSFAAAPSNERVENRRRESSMGELRLLLSLDEVWILREDLSGMTARARAMKEHRSEAANLRFTLRLGQGVDLPIGIGTHILGDDRAPREPVYRDAAEVNEPLNICRRGGIDHGAGA